MKEWQILALMLGGIFSVIALIIFLASSTPTREERRESITEPQYTVSCYNSGLDEGQVTVKVKTWRTWRNGFTLYYMDGTDQWFSDGNACTVKKIERVGNEFDD